MSKKVKDLANAVDDFKREIRAGLGNLKDIVKRCSDICDGVNEIKTEKKALRKEVQRLTNQNEGLTDENRKLSEKIEELEQYLRANNLEVKGVPEDGDALDVMKRIGNLVNERIDVLISATASVLSNATTRALLSAFYSAQSEASSCRNARSRKLERKTLTMVAKAHLCT